MLVSESFFVQDWSIIRVYPDESIICLHVQNDYLCVQLYMKGQTKHQLWAKISQIESTCQENKKSQSYKLLFDAILQKLEGRPIVFLRRILGWYWWWTRSLTRRNHWCLTFPTYPTYLVNPYHHTFKLTWPPPTDQQEPSPALPASWQNATERIGDAMQTLEVMLRDRSRLW